MPITVSDVTSRAMLDAYAQQAVYDYGTQVVTLSQGMLPVDIPFGGVGAGDVVTIDQDFGLGPTSSIRRISRMAVSSTSQGERLAVDFV